MNRRALWFVLVLLSAACEPILPERPWLCVTNADTSDPGECVPTSSPCAEVALDRALLVEHVLPPLVVPYGPGVTFVASAGDAQTSRIVKHAREDLADAGVRWVARTSFEPLDAGLSVELIRASMLNSEVELLAKPSCK